MKATIHVGGKVSKAKGRSVSAAVLDGLEHHPDGLEWGIGLAPGDPSPTSAIMRALAHGLALAALNTATEVEVYVPNKSAVKAMDGTGGVKFDTAWAARLTAWSIYITRDLMPGGWSVEYVPAKLLDDRVAARLDSVLNTPEHVQETLAVAA